MNGLGLMRAIILSYSLLFFIKGKTVIIKLPPGISFSIYNDYLGFN